MKIKIEEKMNDIKSWIIKEKNFLILLAVMTISLAVAMFTHYALIICFLVGAFCATFFSFEKSISLFFFSFAFEIIFYTGSINNRISHIAMFYALIFIICFLKYFIKVIEKKKTINLKSLLFLVPLLLYVLLPINSYSISHIVKYVVALGFIYLLLEYKKEINFDNILIVASFGLIVSFIFVIFKPYSSRITGLIGVYYNFDMGQIVKRQGMFSNPNLLALYSILIITWTVYKFLKGDILWIVPMIFIFSYSYGVLSREFLLCLLVLIALLVIYNCIIKNKDVFLKTLIIFGVFIIVALTQFKLTQIYFERLKAIFYEIFELFNIGKDNPIQNQEEIIDSSTTESTNANLWIDGTPIDPGRVGLWKRYYKDFTSSAKTTLFGRGISAEFLGMSTHNTFVEIFWRLGIVGTLLLGVVCCLIAKEIVRRNNYLTFNLLVIILIINCCEACLFNSIALIMMVMLIGSLNKEKKVEHEAKDEEKVNHDRERTLNMIPKKIHYIWLGGKEEPAILQKCKKSWQKYCPDYKIIRWDESNLDLEKYKFAKDAYEAKKFAFASDVFRFDILAKEGGIYLDVDVEIVKSLDEFLKYDLFMGFENEEQVAPGLILGAVQGQNNIKELLELYKTLDFNSSNLGSITIPIITTNYICDKFNMQKNNQNQLFDEGKIAVFSTEYFCPKSMVDGKIRKTKNTVSIHWYNASWYTPFQKFKHKCKIIANVLTFGLAEKLIRKMRNRKG